MCDSNLSGNFQAHRGSAHEIEVPYWSPIGTRPLSKVSAMTSSCCVTGSEPGNTTAVATSTKQWFRELWNQPGIVVIVVSEL